MDLVVVEAVLVVGCVVREEELDEEISRGSVPEAGEWLRDLPLWTLSLAPAQSFSFRSSALSTLLPSSSCSSTLRSGKRLGIILRGRAPSTTEYFEKSSTPRCLRRKSSSSSSSPLTVDVGAMSMARIASEKIVCRQR